MSGTRFALTSLACFIGLALAASALAEAAPRRALRPAPAAQYEPTPDPACIRICPEDYSPCDPVYYKVADHRCNYERRR